MKRSQKWNILQICPRRYSNSVVQRATNQITETPLPSGMTRVINTVQSRAYSRSGFSANSILITADVNVERKEESGEGEIGPWPHLSTMFRFLSRKSSRLIGARLEFRSQHRMTSYQTVRMMTSLLKSATINSFKFNAAWWVSADSIYRDYDSRNMATFQAAVLRNKHSPAS